MHLRGGITRARGGFTFTELLIVGGILAGLVWIATPNIHYSRPRANKRACFANQKTLAGALEMYRLDFQRDPPRLDAELFEALKTNGYLCSIPNDPGQGRDSSHHYQITRAFPPGVICTVHGAYPGSLDPIADLETGDLEERLRKADADPGVVWVAGEVQRTLGRRRGWARLEGLLAGIAGSGLLALLGWGCLLWGRRSGAGGAATCGQARSARGSGWEPVEVRLQPALVLVTPAVARCPVCACGFEPEHGPVVRCGTCEALHHRECRDYNRGCATYACGG